MMGDQPRRQPRQPLRTAEAALLRPVEIASAALLTFLVTDGSSSDLKRGLVTALARAVGTVHGDPNDRALREVSPPSRVQPEKNGCVGRL